MWLKLHFRGLQAMPTGQGFIQQMFAEHLLPAPLPYTWDPVVNETDQTVSSKELTCQIDSLTRGQVGFACEITEAGQLRAKSRSERLEEATV